MCVCWSAGAKSERKRAADVGEEEGEKGERRREERLSAQDVARPSAVQQAAISGANGRRRAEGKAWKE